jgi:hypothetical protein
MHFSTLLISSFPKELAYLDPGSGSIILQLALAAALGIVVFIRFQWGRIKGIFGKKSNDSNDTEEE